jgi:hypothetical protein
MLFLDFNYMNVKRLNEPFAVIAIIDPSRVRKFCMVDNPYPSHL